jgi:hypothetical protein
MIVLFKITNNLKSAFKKVYVNTTSATFVSVLNISGSGILYAIQTVYVVDVGEIKITIDGVSQIFTMDSAGKFITRDMLNFTAGNLFLMTSVTYTDAINIEFKSNLKIEMKALAGGTALAAIMYGES